jgi:hypothetical protein
MAAAVVVGVCGQISPGPMMVCVSRLFLGICFCYFIFLQLWYQMARLRAFQKVVFGSRFLHTHLLTHTLPWLGSNRTGINSRDKRTGTDCTTTPPDRKY